jgi:hypothetical protein
MIVGGTFFFSRNHMCSGSFGTALFLITREIGIVATSMDVQRGCLVDIATVRTHELLMLSLLLLLTGIVRRGRCVSSGIGGRFSDRYGITITSIIAIRTCPTSAIPTGSF